MIALRDARMADDSESPRTVRAEEFCSASFWRAFAPSLQIGAVEHGAPTVPHQDYARLSRRMERDGYFGDSDARLHALAPMIGQTVKKLVRFGLPPVLTWVYDEPWECFRRLESVIGHFLGADYKLLPDFWAWHVNPRNNEAGWQPHRDKSTGSLAPDGAPLSLTCWIPLSDATPLNSCMYVVPAYLDPNYNKGGGADLEIPYIARAIPAKPGDFLIWNQAILHWGGLTSEFGEEPRMSMALEFQRGDIAPFRQPLLDRDAPLSFSERVRLIARQILQYTHIYVVQEKHVHLAQFLNTAPLQDN